MTFKFCGVELIYLLNVTFYAKFMRHKHYSQWDYLNEF